MPLTDRENHLRTASFQGPEWIPCEMALASACWHELREDLEEVVLRHPLLFPDFKKGDVDFDELPRRAGMRFTDNWGCTWDHAYDGIAGQVVEHPLSDWSKLADYPVPDPLENPEGWQRWRDQTAANKAEGRLAVGKLTHGFYFMRLYYIRGYEAFLCDMVEGPPELQQLIDMLTDHWRVIVDMYLETGIDVLRAGDDLGTQTQSMMGRDLFRRWIMPGYKAFFLPCRERGWHVDLHTDGYVMDIIDELIECGVSILNLQDLCNGLDDIRRQIKGRICIRLDLDRQKIIPFGTPREIDELIEEEVRTLGSAEGGLMLDACIYPGTPAENIDAVLSAMEKYRTWWWDGRARTRGNSAGH